MNSSAVRLSQDGFGNYSTQRSLDKLQKKSTKKASSQMTQTQERGEQKKPKVDKSKDQEQEKPETSPLVEAAKNQIVDGTEEEQPKEVPEVESPSPPVVSLTVRRSEEGSVDASASKKNRHRIMSRVGYSNVGGHGSEDGMSQEREAMLSQSSHPKRSMVRFPHLGRASVLDQTHSRPGLVDDVRLSKNINYQNVSNRYGSQDLTAHQRYSSQGKIEVSRELQHLHQTIANDEGLQDAFVDDLRANRLRNRRLLNQSALSTENYKKISRKQQKAMRVSDAYQ